MEPVTPDVLGLTLLVLLLLSNALLSASKAALINARKQPLRDLAEEGNRRAKRALDLAEGGTRLLATAQVGAVLAHFLMAGLVAIFVVPLLSDALSAVPWLASVRFGLSYLFVILLGAFVLFLLGETLPEMAATHRADSWVMILANVMRLAQIVLAPLVSSAQWLGGLLAGLGGGEQQANLPFVTEEEILTLVDAGEEEGVIELDEKQMITSIFKLDNTLVREVMVPRIDMVALPADTPLREALDVVIKAGHSRIPVYKESVDAIAGLLYAKDLLEVWRDGKEDVDLTLLLRAPIFVPETKKLDDLLNELQQMKVHLAIVVDEYGGTAGLVTIEDVVEEIVGEIQDEYDSEEAIYRQVAENEFEFDARIDIDDLNEVLDSDLPTELGDTLGGYIYSQLGKVPTPGEEVIEDGLHLEVLSVDEQRIEKVRIRLLPQDQPGDALEGNVHV
jgi:CBS domain containing-hemolysin-like protein